MPWTVLALLSAVFSLAMVVPILLHAFRRSVGTGVMVLCIPGYILLYAFSQFEHPQRHWLVPALLGAVLLCGTFAGLATVPPANSRISDVTRDDSPGQ